MGTTWLSGCAAAARQRVGSGGGWRVVAIVSMTEVVGSVPRGAVVLIVKKKLIGW
jgi:hypothetical protein